MSGSPCNRPIVCHTSVLKNDRVSATSSSGTTFSIELPRRVTVSTSERSMKPTSSNGPATTLRRWRPCTSAGTPLRRSHVSSDAVSGTLIGHSYGGLSEQQQRRTGQFEQQDLETCLLAAGQGAERLIALLLQAVPAQRAHRPAPVDAGPSFLAVPEQVDERSVEPLRMRMRLREQPGHDACSQSPLPTVPNRLA